MIRTTNSSKETYDLGYTLGKYIPAGSLICVEGEMGAGKTALSQGIIRGLGIVDTYITSPTYTLVNEYGSEDFPIYHFDVYRIMDYEELTAIGFEEYLREDSVVIIEWADIIGQYLPEERIWITIKKTGEEDGRKITLEGLHHLKKDPLPEEFRKWEKK